MARIRVEIHECWYGQSEAHGKDVWLWVLVGPEFGINVYNRGFTTVMSGVPPRMPERKLVIQGLSLPVHGPCVLRTSREYMKSEYALLDAPNRPGKPEFGIDLSFDPQGDQGAWGERLLGKWKVKLVIAHRKTAWERL